MGEIKCANKSLISRLDLLRTNSVLLNKIVNKILEDGDLDVSIVNGGHSSFNRRKIVLAVRDGMSKSDVEAVFIMELCNTYYEVQGRKPHPQQFGSAEGYGDAMEMLEWKAIKKHVKVLAELQSSTSPLGPSKYARGFNEFDWGNFKSYLANQRAKGHTARIEAHWIPGTDGL